jgi:hypothetical protein
LCYFNHRSNGQHMLVYHNHSYIATHKV